MHLFWTSIGLSLKVFPATIPYHLPLLSWIPTIINKRPRTTNMNTTTTSFNLWSSHVQNVWNSINDTLRKNGWDYHLGHFSIFSRLNVMISYPINLLLVYSQNCSLKISDKNNDFPVHLKSNYLCNKTLPFQFHLLFFIILT